MQWSIVAFHIVDDCQLIAETLKRLDDKQAEDQVKILIEAVTLALSRSFKLLAAPKKARVLRRYLVNTLHRLVVLSPTPMVSTFLPLLATGKV